MASNGEEQERKNNKLRVKEMEKKRFVRMRMRRKR
jgi:hypothetical protein